MMDFKKIVRIFFFTALVFLLSACNSLHSREDLPEENNTHEDIQAENNSTNGVWLTCYELKSMLSDGSEAAFRAQVNKVTEECKSKGINTVFLHVRPFADSVYPSQIFPMSEYVLSDSGEKPDFDVLSVFIELADKAGIKVHAWINPYRISYKTSLSQLDKNNIASYEKIKDSVVCTDAGIYLNPCFDTSRLLVLNGVREILENYAVSGIHIDDYFYPQTDDDFDKTQYAEYSEQGGKLTMAQWRRENVNSLVSAVYSLVHSYGNDLVFSISPTGDIDKNINSYYADVRLWLSRKGYADIIIPQLYYGFEHSKMPFEGVAAEWLSLERADGVSLLCGLAAYKQGTEDEFAGKGSDEWINNGDIIQRQIKYVSDSAYNGYVLFSYKNIFI